MKVDLVVDRFDSELLRRKCVKVHLSGAAPTLARKDVQRMLHTLPRAEAIFVFTEYHPAILAALGDENFTLISTRNVYETCTDSEIAALQSPTDVESANVLWKAEAGRRFSAESFTPLVRALVSKSRYWKDERIPKEQAIQVYERWFYNSIYATFADEVVVAHDGDSVLGLVSLKEQEGVGYLDLVVVDEAAQGRGIGRRLVTEAVRYFAAREMARVKVETEGENVTANRFYQKLGFVVDTHALVFHKHFTR